MDLGLRDLERADRMEDETKVLEEFVPTARLEEVYRVLVIWPTILKKIINKK